MNTFPIAMAIEAVEEELYRARDRFSDFRSAHEGYAIILEELDEAWDEIKRNETQKAREEMTQVAAMAIRFLVDIQP